VDADIQTGVVPANCNPKPNTITVPPPGGVLNSISPWMPEFQAHDYIKLLDDKIAEITGINDLLLGLRGSSGSSKEMRTQIELYTPRIGLKRSLLYSGMIAEHWEMAAKMWERKDERVKSILDGHYDLEIEPPEIVKKDDQEEANRITTLVAAGLMSLRTGMMHVGIVNPTEEVAQVMEEWTNAAIHPEKVQAQGALITQFNAMGLNPQQVGQEAQQPLGLREQALNDLNARREAAAKLKGGPGANVPAVNPNVMPGEAMPQAANPMQAQSMVQRGEASSRLLSSSDIPVGQ